MQVKHKVTAILSTALMALAMTFTAAASPIKLTATIDGMQANAGAGTGSLATGFAMMVLETSTNDFSWDISWEGLTAEATAAHFHGPALPTQNGAVVRLIAFSMGEAMGNTTLTDSEASDLLNGLWYINIHTGEFPGGEIRGQVMVPAPSIVFLVLISMSALWCRQSRKII